MRTETIVTFYCEKCGTGYRSQRLAAHCESGALPCPPLEMSEGQKIWIAVDHQMDAAQFGGWAYRSAPGFDLNDEVADEDEHINLLLSRDPTHKLIIRLAEPHHYEESEQTFAYLDTTALNKHDANSMTGRKIYCGEREWYE